MAGSEQGTELLQCSHCSHCLQSWLQARKAPSPGSMSQRATLSTPGLKGCLALPAQSRFSPLCLPPTARAALLGPVRLDKPRRVRWEGVHRPLRAGAERHREGLAPHGRLTGRHAAGGQNRGSRTHPDTSCPGLAAGPRHFPHLPRGRWVGAGPGRGEGNQGVGTGHGLLMACVTHDERSADPEGTGPSRSLPRAPLPNPQNGQQPVLPSRALRSASSGHDATLAESV